jgi:formylglycine-generating enzyme required for sulfatase activity
MRAHPRETGGQSNSAETRARGPVDVKSYPSGASPYGVHNMAGNVWEWVADWYDDGYYQRSVTRDPTGPAGGKYRARCAADRGTTTPATSEQQSAITIGPTSRTATSGSAARRDAREEIRRHGVAGQAIDPVVVQTIRPWIVGLMGRWPAM